MKTVESDLKASATGSIKRMESVGLNPVVPSTHKKYDAYYVSLPRKSIPRSLREARPQVFRFLQHTHRHRYTRRLRVTDAKEQSMIKR